MTGDFYIRHGGRTQGPFSVEKLHEMAQRGRFSRAYQVSTDRVSWQRAGTFPELFPQAAPPKVRIPRSAPVGNRDDIDRAEEAWDEQSGSEMEAETYNLQQDSPDPEPATEGALWFYTINDKDQKPIPFEQLQTLVSQGRLQSNDQVWTDGMDDWVDASRVAALAPLFPAEIATGPQDAGQPAAPQPGGSQQPGATETAPMAVASLVLGLLGTTILYFLGSILAVVFGHIALRQIEESDGRLGGHGLAVAGLIFGYAVIVISVVAGIVFFLAVLLGIAGAAAGA